MIGEIDAGGGEGDFLYFVRITGLEELSSSRLLASTVPLMLLRTIRFSFSDSPR